MINKKLLYILVLLNRLSVSTSVHELSEHVIKNMVSFMSNIYHSYRCTVRYIRPCHTATANSIKMHVSQRKCDETIKTNVCHFLPNCILITTNRNVQDDNGYSTHEESQTQILHILHRLSLATHMKSGMYYKRMSNDTNIENQNNI